MNQSLNTAMKTSISKIGIVTIVTGYIQIHVIGGLVGRLERCRARGVSGMDWSRDGAGSGAGAGAATATGGSDMAELATGTGTFGLGGTSGAVTMASGRGGAVGTVGTTGPVILDWSWSIWRRATNPLSSLTVYDSGPVGCSMTPKVQVVVVAVNQGIQKVTWPKGAGLWVLIMLLLLVSLL